ncbi:MAG: energy transducer TonB [Pseudomonadota bacterium]
MSYVTQKQTHQPVAILGAIGIPAAFAGLLVVGLAVKAVVNDAIDDGFTGVTVTPTIPPPPPKPIEEPDPSPKTQPSETITYAPETPFPNPSQPSGVETTGELTPFDGDIDLGGVDTGDLGIGDGIGSKPAFDPIAAKPANNPSRWVTDRDYRSSWVRRDLSGTAGFLLQISASGRVTDCSITSSTGHKALDAATCKLIAKRARFDPAMDGNGAPTAGTYRSSVNWQLPE